MNANATRSNINRNINPFVLIKYCPASSISVSSGCNWRILRARRNLSSSTSCSRSSLVIETSASTTIVEGQQVYDEDRDTGTDTEEAVASNSVARRLILLRHAKSSWDNPSLRGQLFPFFTTHCHYFISGSLIHSITCLTTKPLISKWIFQIFQTQISASSL